MNSYFHIQPIKLKIKDMLNKSEILPAPLSINQLITIYYKEVTILKHERPKLH